MLYFFGDLAKGLVFSSKLPKNLWSGYIAYRNDFNIRDEQGGN
jgi:hypothetical protein